MNFANELGSVRQGIYFKMLDDLEIMKNRGLELLDIYFVYQEKDQPQDKIVFKIISEQMDKQSNDIKKLQEKIQEFTQRNFSLKELEALKFEYSLR